MALFDTNMIPIFSYFSDPVRPLRDLWIVGEGFLRSIYGMLQHLKTEAIAANESIPYMYQQIHVHPFYQTSNGTAQGTLHKILNSVIEGLNESNKLPHYILILVDRDIILQLDYFVPGTFFILEQEMKWLTKEIDRCLSGRLDRLRKACPGAVGPQPVAQ